MIFISRLCTVLCFQSLCFGNKKINKKLSTDSLKKKYCFIFYPNSLSKNDTEAVIVRNPFKRYYMYYLGIKMHPLWVNEVQTGVHFESY